MNGFVKKFGFVFLFVALAAGLSSCGRKGALESPTAPQASEAGQTERQENTTPERDFILDGVI